MPSKDEHIANARRNYAFLKDCESKCNVKTTYPEWLFIIRFYVCVHIVEAILATVPIHSTKHDDRLNNVSRLKSHFKNDFEKHFRDLLNTSYLARYSTNLHARINERMQHENETSFVYIVAYAKNEFTIDLEKHAH